MKLRVLIVAVMSCILGGQTTNIFGKQDSPPPASSEATTPTKENIDRYNEALKKCIESNKGADPYNLEKFSQLKIKTVENLLKKGADPSSYDMSKILSNDDVLQVDLDKFQPDAYTFVEGYEWTRKVITRDRKNLKYIISEEAAQIAHALFEAGAKPPSLTPGFGGYKDMWRTLEESYYELDRLANNARLNYFCLIAEGGFRADNYYHNNTTLVIVENLLKDMLRAQIVFEVAEKGLLQGNSNNVATYIAQARKCFADRATINLLNMPYPYPDETKYPNSLYGKHVKGFTPVELAAKNGHSNCLKVMLEATGDDGKPLVMVKTAQKALKTAQFAVADITNVSSAFKKCKKLLEDFIKRNAPVKSVAATAYLRQQRQQHPQIPV
jgi:hypothetical protein